MCLAGLSTDDVAYDQFHEQPGRCNKAGRHADHVMYGARGLLLYVRPDKEPGLGEHKTGAQPLWKQAVGVTFMCRG